MRTTPHVRQLSATLKSAKCRRSMKSTTAPRPTPGARISRSHRFPMAPASTRPSAASPSPPSAAGTPLMTITTAVTTATPVNSTVAAGPKPKAAPEFRVTSMVRIRPTIWIGGLPSRVAGHEHLGGLVQADTRQRGPGKHRRTASVHGHLFQYGQVTHLAAADPPTAEGRTRCADLVRSCWWHVLGFEPTLAEPTVLQRGRQLHWPHDLEQATVCHRQEAPGRSLAQEVLVDPGPARPPRQRRSRRRSRCRLPRARPATARSPPLQTAENGQAGIALHRRLGRGGEHHPREPAEVEQTSMR